MKSSLNPGRGRVHQGHVSPPWPTVKEWEMKGRLKSLSAHVRGIGLQLALESLSKAFCRLAFKMKGLRWLEKLQWAENSYCKCFYKHVPDAFQKRRCCTHLLAGGWVGWFVFCSISVHRAGEGLCAWWFGNTMSANIHIKYVSAVYEYSDLKK